MSDVVPDLLVEKLALGELSDAEASAVRERLGPSAQARLDAIAADDARTMAALPPALLAAQVAERLRLRDGALSGRETAPARAAWIWGAAGLAAVGLFGWLVVGVQGPDRIDDTVSGISAQPESSPTKIAQREPSPGQLSGGQPSTGIRFKGGTKLSVHRKGARTSPSMALAPGTHVAAGDTLQLSYAAGDAEYGVIVSIDGAGTATLHFPATVTGDPSLRGRAQLPYGYELDDAPQFERFIFVTSGEPLAVADVLDAAQALAQGPDAREAELALDEGVEQLSVLLVK